MSTTERITAIITFAILSAIIIFFFGPDFFTFLKGFIPGNDDDDTTPPAPPTQPTVELQESATTTRAPKKWYNI